MMESIELERASVVAEELADLARAARANGGTQSPDLLGAIDRLFMAGAEDADDAMALLTYSKILIDNLMRADEVCDQAGNAETLMIVSDLLTRSLPVLEKLTGRRCDEFVGRNP